MVEKCGSRCHFDRLRNTGVEACVGCGGQGQHERSCGDDSRWVCFLRKSVDQTQVGRTDEGCVRLRLASHFSSFRWCMGLRSWRAQCTATRLQFWNLSVLSMSFQTFVEKTRCTRTCAMWKNEITLLLTVQRTMMRRQQRRGLVLRRVKSESKPPSGKVLGEPQ